MFSCLHCYALSPLGNWQRQLEIAFWHFSPYRHFSLSAKKGLLVICYLGLFTKQINPAIKVSEMTPSTLCIKVLVSNSDSNEQEL